MRYFNRMGRWRAWTLQIDLSAWSLLPELRVGADLRCVYFGWLCVGVFWCRASEWVWYDEGED